jgi:hypothetical protein
MLRALVGTISLFAFLSCKGGPGRDAEDLRKADADTRPTDVKLSVVDVSYSYGGGSDDVAMELSVEITNRAEELISLAPDLFQLEDDGGLLERPRSSAACMGQELITGGDHTCDLTFGTKVGEHFVALHYNYGAETLMGRTSMDEIVPEEPPPPVCNGALVLWTEECEDCRSQHNNLCVEEFTAADWDCKVTYCGGCQTPDNPLCECHVTCPSFCPEQQAPLAACLRQTCPVCVL